MECRHGVELLETNLHRLCIINNTVFLQNRARGTRNIQLRVLLRGEEVVPILVEILFSVGIRCSGFHDLEIQDHEIVDVHPSARVGAFFVVKRLAAHFRHFLDEHGDEDAVRFRQTTTKTVDIWWTHDCDVYFVARVLDRGVQDLLGVAMQRSIGQIADLFDGGDVAPYLWVEFPEIIGFRPVGYDSRARQVK